MKLLQQFPIIIVLFLAILSCKDNALIDSELTKTKSHEIFPLAVGNYWEYQSETYKNDTLYHVGVYTIEVVDKIKIQLAGKSIDVFKIKENIDAWWAKTSYIQYSLYNYEGDGLYR